MAVIVVVGGGAAGANVVRGLASQLIPSRHQIILVTCRPQYVNLLGSLRLMVDETQSVDNVFLPYDKVFGHFPPDIRVASVTSIEEMKNGIGGLVNLSTGESVQYDVLVLATGSVWEGLVAFPNEVSEYHAHVATWRKRFREAQNIVIAGGGPVGIELAGELKDVYPSKSVTIVQGDRLLLNDMYPDRFRKSLVERLRQRGVDIILNDAIKGNPPVDSSVKTRDGKELDCDLLVTCRGGGANTSYMKFLRPLPLTERGYVKVHPTMEVQFHPGIFALGDIVDWPEVKQMAKINMGHAGIVVANVLSLIHNEPMERYYQGTIDIMAICIGRNGGASYFGILWGFILGNWITKQLKSKKLLIGKTRQILGLDAA